MNTTAYLCTNFGSCEHADNKTPIEIAIGAESVCPCGFPLRLKAPGQVPKGGNVKGDTRTGSHWRWALVAGCFGTAVVVIGASVVLRGQMARAIVGNHPDHTAQVPGAGMPVPPATASGQDPTLKPGLGPDAAQMGKDRAELDKRTRKGGDADLVADQHKLMARDHITAAVQLMQQAQWDEAGHELEKAQQENPDEPLTFVNMAILELHRPHRATSHSDPQDTAVRLIGEATRKGFKDFTVLESDPDLRAVVQLPAFKQLISAQAAR